MLVQLAKIQHSAFALAQAFRRGFPRRLFGNGVPFTTAGAAPGPFAMCRTAALTDKMFSCFCHYAPLSGYFQGERTIFAPVDKLIHKGIITFINLVDPTGPNDLAAIQHGDPVSDNAGG